MTPEQARLTLDAFETNDPVLLGRNFRAIDRAANALPIPAPVVQSVTPSPVPYTIVYSTTFADSNLGPSFTFKKAHGWTRVLIDFRVSAFYTTTAPSGVTFSVVIGDTYVYCGDRIAQTASVYETWSYVAVAPSIPAGVYTVQAHAAPWSSGQNFVMDSACAAQLILTETA